jgi:hypothetical protein
MSRSLFTSFNQAGGPAMPARSTALCLPLVAVLAILLARPAPAQISGDYVYDSSKHAYFIHGDTTVNGDISGNEVFVGKDNAAAFTTLNPSPPITLSVNAGAKTTDHGNPYPDGKFYGGVNVFGHNTVNVSGGSVGDVGGAGARGFDTSIINFSGGTLMEAVAFGTSTVNFSAGTFINGLSAYETGTVNISGGSGGSLNTRDMGTVNFSAGTVNSAQNFNSGTMNISGGTLTYVAYNWDVGAINITGGSVNKAEAHKTSTFNISGGTVANGLTADGTSTINVSGGNVQGTLAAHNTSTFSISGGTVATVDALDTSLVNFSGGIAQDLLGRNASTLNLSGGSLTSETIRLFNTSVANLSGSDLSFVLTGVGKDLYGGYATYDLSGQLTDGQSLNGYVLHDYSFHGFFSGGGNSLSFFAGIGPAVGAPEPASLLLLVPGLLALTAGTAAARRRRTA